MARKYLVIDSRGVISDRALSGKNKRKNYYIIGKSRNRNIYARFGWEGRVKPTKSYPKARQVMRRGGGSPPPEKPAMLEVAGLVGLDYRKDISKPFHAEMLFTWRGPIKYSRSHLLSEAIEVLRERLASLGTIPSSLLSRADGLPENLFADGKFGIVLETEYFGGEYEVMDIEIFIPEVGFPTIITDVERGVKA
ncbi:hypothetical protein DRQ25_17875 [Candidatus Fermentibacteria bacterium]|nr:MAG: hypothetical protein DRQ25_17875 [Candidatus Fermentibacteria bacterium]